jgi:hypothetical protein
MQESHGEDRASHTDPESCTEGVSELLICYPLWMSEGKRTIRVTAGKWRTKYPANAQAVPSLYGEGRVVKWDQAQMNVCEGH